MVTLTETTCSPGQPGPHYRIVHHAVRDDISGEEGICTHCGDVKWYPDSRHRVPRRIITIPSCTRCGKEINVPDPNNGRIYCDDCLRWAQQQGAIQVGNTISKTDPTIEYHQRVFTLIIGGISTPQEISYHSGLSLERVRICLSNLRYRQVIANAGTLRRAQYVSCYKGSLQERQAEVLSLMTSRSLTVEELVKETELPLAEAEQILSAMIYLGTVERYRRCDHLNYYYVYHLPGRGKDLSRRDAARRRILQYLRRQDSTAAEIAQALAFSQRYVSRLLQELPRDVVEYYHKPLNTGLCKTCWRLTKRDRSIPDR